MDNDCDFDLMSREVGLFFEDQNALDAAQPDLSCELPFVDLLPFFYAQSAVNCDWPQSANRIHKSLEESQSLDIKTHIFRPKTQDEIEMHTQECTDDYSEWMRTAWPIGDPNSRKTSDQRLTCHYPGCTSSPFRTTCDLKTHLKCHLHEILCYWVDGHDQACRWPGCPSKATFKSKKALQTHLDNIHVNPLLCPEKGCPYRNPFRNNYDLKRHVKTIHYGENELQFRCPFLKCGQFPKTFVRKDKWLNHLRTEHDESVCPLNHCEVGTTGMETKLVEHIKNCHGNFECGIGSCSKQPPSRFAKFDLMRHLEFHHEIQHGDLDTAQNLATQARDRTIRDKDLPHETIWRNCRLCLGRSSLQESGSRKTSFLD